MVKNPPANAGETGDEGSIPGLRGSSGGGNGNPLQYSCVKNPTDRGAWWATVPGGTKRQLTEQLTHTNTLLSLSFPYTKCLAHNKNILRHMKQQENIVHHKERKKKVKTWLRCFF